MQDVEVPFVVMGGEPVLLCFAQVAETYWFMIMISFVDLLRDCVWLQGVWCADVSIFKHILAMILCNFTPKSVGKCPLVSSNMTQFRRNVSADQTDNIYICAQTWLYKNNLERIEMVHRIRSVWHLFVEWACNFKWFSPNGLEAARIHA